MPIPIFDDVAAARGTILRRMPLDEVTVPPALLDGIERIFGARLSPAEAVDRIIRDVRARGDDALFDWSALLDNGGREALEVPRARWQAAAEALEPALLDALRLAAAEIDDEGGISSRNPSCLPMIVARPDASTTTFDRISEGGSATRYAITPTA